MIRGLLALALLAACTPEAPAPSATRDYICADGTRIAAVYGKDGETDSVTLTYKGATSLLLAETAASGVRYGWPSDGSNYVWWTKGNMATLYWKDGETGGTETVLHSDCQTQ